jgi:hypothetical protein
MPGGLIGASGFDFRSGFALRSGFHSRSEELNSHEPIKRV